MLTLDADKLRRWGPAYIHPRAVWLVKLAILACNQKAWNEWQAWQESPVEKQGS